MRIDRGRGTVLYTEREKEGEIDVYKEGKEDKTGPEGCNGKRQKRQWVRKEAECERR